MKNINIETLKKIIDLHYNLIIPLNISDTELWENYAILFEEQTGQDMTENDLERLVKKDILFDYVFDFNNVEIDIILAMENYEEDSKEFENIKTMIKEICKAFELNSQRVFGVEI